MDRRERFDDPQEALRNALAGHQAQVWTALPGIIQSFNAGAVTASVQPAIKGKVTDQTGKVTTPNLPLLVDVPVVFQRGGGVSLTFPVAAGDECLVVFSARCIDGWWQEGGIQPALDARQHDLSDAFAIVGPYSQRTKIGGVSTTAAQLRTDDGSTLIEVKGGAVTLKAAKVLIVSADVQISGASLTHNGVNIGSTHVHPDAQGGTTGGPS